MTMKEVCVSTPSANMDYVCIVEFQILKLSKRFFEQICCQNQILSFNFLGLLIFLIQAYNVVLLPLPVGPVTKTIPCGDSIAEINFL